jgi:hypothetical protein
MDTDKGLELLRAQLAGSAAAADGQDFDGWRERTSTVMHRVTGDSHDLTVRFEDIHYSPMVFTPGDAYAFDVARRGEVKLARAILEAAIFDLGIPVSDEDLAAGLVDVEL